MLRLEQQVDTLPVRVYDTREEMGRAAAGQAADAIRALIREKGEANVVFAAAPSQLDLLAGLLEEKVDWSRVRAFHQDEYIGLDPAHPAGFGNFLRRHFYDKVPLMACHFLECTADEVEAKSAAYTALLEQYPPDVIFLGVGENGHLAFNDPPVADFEDPLTIRAVELDPVCRQQQVNDGCFPAVEEVPARALTFTLSAIRRIPCAIAVVPTSNKAEAIRSALCGPVGTACPASSLRTHPGAALYLDRDSAAKAFPA